MTVYAAKILDRDLMDYRERRITYDDLERLAMDAWAQGLRIEWLWLRYAFKTGQPPGAIQGPLHLALMNTGRAIARSRGAR